MEHVPFSSDWANATLDTVTQSLEAGFGFKALYHNTGPPYTIELDIMQELADAQVLHTRTHTHLARPIPNHYPTTTATLHPTNYTQIMADAGDFATDVTFQEHVQSIFQTTRDAHTRYQKPACYAVTFVMPFAFNVTVVETTSGSDTVVHLQENIYTQQYADFLGAGAPDPFDFIGREIVLVDNLEVTTAVSSWGDSHATRSNNRGVRFNTAIRDYLYVLPTVYQPCTNCYGACSLNP